MLTEGDNAREINPQDLESEVVYESETPRPIKLQRLKDVFQKQAVYPPGGDMMIAASFQAALQNPKLLDIVLDSQDVRRTQEHPLSYPHAVSLLVPVTNHIMRLREGNPDFVQDPSLQTVEGWVDLQRYLIDTHEEDMRALYETRDNQTTKAQRGVSLPLIVHSLFNGKPITAVDPGCSANMIWSHLAERRQFEEVEVDMREDGLHNQVVESVQKPINVNFEMGVDRVDPLASSEDIEWFLSCMHFDEISSERIQEARQMISRIKNHEVPNVTFFRGDILELDIPLRDVDIATIFTVLYQYPDELREQIIHNAGKLVNPKTGVIVIQDYCHVVDNEIQFIDERKFYDYSTVVTGPATKYKPLEVLNFRDTSCKSIRTGQHYADFLQLADQT